MKKLKLMRSEKKPRFHLEAVSDPSSLKLTEHLLLKDSNSADLDHSDAACGSFTDYI